MTDPNPLSFPSGEVNETEHRRRFEFWKSMCEHRDAYDVRVYLIQHVHEVLNGLKEFQFELRDEIQAFISNQETRWPPQEPWMWTDAMNVSRPGPKQAVREILEGAKS